MKDSNRKHSEKADASYLAVGGLEGITKLVGIFYYHMETQAFAKRIRKMHPDDLTLSKAKLVCFLAGWLGGPRTYAQRFGPIRIPIAHRHLDVGPDERDAWIQCMQLALREADYPHSFQDYLLQALGMPAEKIRLVSEARQAQEAK